jgi:diguanylate cyclase
MLRMDPQTLRQAEQQLKQTTDEHAEWHENLLRAVFCGQPDGVESFAPASHRECSFGRWFYDCAPNGLRDQPSFTAMGKEHQRLHQVASKLMRAVKAGEAIARPDFEELVATSARLRLHVDALKSLLETALRDRDALTGAYGRLEMLPVLHDLRAQVQRGGAPCTLVFMDIDHLKWTNDTHGHQVGDAVLSGAVHHLDAHLRSGDKVFRYGGDEFLVALPGADLAVAQAVITRIRDGLAQQTVIAGPGGEVLRVTASFGIALLDPDAEVLESIGRADQALLLAKTAGRNRVIRWDDTITTGTRWRRIDVDQVP